MELWSLSQVQWESELQFTWDAVGEERFPSAHPGSVPESVKLTNNRLINSRKDIYTDLLIFHVVCTRASQGIKSEYPKRVRFESLYTLLLIIKAGEGGHRPLRGE